MMVVLVMLELRIIGKFLVSVDLHNLTIYLLTRLDLMI
jgi:hypothetical protein